ncbi:gamma-aminobutyric acid type B receptor subunit 1-like [Glandiceps talaboti]
MAARKEPIYIGGLLVLSGEDVFWAGSVYPGVLLALEDINQRNNILPDHELKVVVNDTRGDAGMAIHSLIGLASSPPTKIMLLGGAQGEEAVALAETSKWWNMIHVAPATTIPLLSDRERFPFCFRTRMSLLMFSPVNVALLNYFGWQQVGLIYTNDASFLTIVRILTNELTQAQITIVASEPFESGVSPSYQVRKVKESGARIIFILAFTFTDQRLVLCEAYRNGMEHPKFVWISFGPSKVPYWDMPDPLVPCALSEVRAAVEGVLKTGQDLIPSGKPTISNMTKEDFNARYYNVAAQHGLTDVLSLYHSMGYDAIWAMALALNSSIAKLPDGKKLEDFDYSDKEMAQIFLEEMAKTSFEGMSGPVTFNEFGDRYGAIDIRQIQDGKYENVGMFYHTDNKIEWMQLPRWGDDPSHVPYDHKREFPRIMRIKPKAFYIVCVIAVSGICLACAFLVFNIYNRKKRFIKMSSPNINNPQAWLLSTGFTVSFGAMFSKTWRVHKIFTNKTVTTLDAENGEDYMYVPEVEVCMSKYINIWLGLMCGYKGIVLLFGVFLAWETRKVNIPQLNDSRYIGFAVYNVLVMSLTGVPTMMMLQADQLLAKFAIISLCIIFCTTGTLCLVFVPKVLELRSQMSTLTPVTDITDIGNTDESAVPSIQL